MIKQVLAGAAFATAATMAIAAPASAATATQAPKAPANALQNLLSSPLAPSPTTSGTGCGCIGDTVSGLTGTTPVGNGTTGKLTSTVSNTTSSLTGTNTGTMGTGAGNGGSSASGSGATDFSTRNGDTVITGEDGDGAGGILNTYGASLINVDGRCLVPLPEGEGIGGHGLTGPKAACNLAPVDQYEAPQKLL
ncbi:hypothetical protein [Streptomyces violascens]|uniref:Secreted protein n=1 Tax=Streptomyces violascens TaxID=67381 RepID=A0ABQ3QLS4_9ACTN|nr:hypothetical protein [Streptomyces violascens]GGU36559.1 hypothetical protein GCM10010289_67050 [Streptomyces violascens]GHI38204.1 hypothetical protein Sviol_26120 [Streptomyces violascens]